MPPLWAHVKRGVAYTWNGRVTDSSEGVQERTRELAVARWALTAAAVPSYLMWLQFVLLSPLHPRSAACLSVLMGMFPFWLWYARKMPVNMVVVLWVAVTVLALDMATNFDTAISASLHFLPALSALLGGGTLVVISTAVALTVLALAGTLSRTETVSDSFFSSSAATLLVANMLIEFVAAVASTWLFARLLRRIERLQDDSDEWSRMLSRDMRTPLHGMTGLADELAEEQLVLRDAESRKIIAGCTRMLQVVCDNMLGPPTEVIRPNIQTLQLSDLVDVVTDLANAMTNLRSQTVEVMLTPTTSDDVFVRLRISDFLQVLGNLVSNAVKFSPVRSKIAITLSCEEEDSSNFYLQMSVEDSGPGVRPELREKIFSLFERGDAHPAIDGLGMGLNIVAQLVAGAGGEVKCLQAAEKLGGARFDVRMPCTVVLRASTPPHDLLVANRNLGRVLVVDDDALNRRILERFLETIGILRTDIIGVQSGEAALDIVEHTESPYGVALLDMVLPGIHGVELARRLSELHARKFPDAPRIALVGASASLTPAVARAWTRVGVVMQLSKPFTRAAVSEALEFVRAEHRTSNRSADAQLQHDAKLEFTAPPWPPNPVKIAKDELITQLDKFDLAIWLRIVASVVFSGASMRGGYSQLLMLFFLWAIAYRWVLNKRPNKFRTAVVVSVFFVLILKSSLSGCGRFVGYATLPLLAGFFFAGNSIYWSLLVCCVGQVGLISLKIWDLAPVCLHIVNVTRAEALQDAAFMTALMAILILIDLSLVALASETRQRWASTISHDVRGPLHGILAACRDLEESEPLTDLVQQLLREVRTNAICLLGVADAVLGLAVPRTVKVDTVRLDELESTLRDLAVMGLGADYAEMSCSLQQPVHFHCDEPLVMYALTRFAAAASLMVVDRVRVHFRIDLDLTGGEENTLLKISAEEAERPPSAGALQHEYVDKATVVWGGESSRPALVRIVEEVLGGTVVFVRDPPSQSASRSLQAPWRLSVGIPVFIAPTAEPSVASTESMQIQLQVTNMSVAVVDDARLNLRVFQRLLDKCGVKDVIQFMSSHRALTALENGELDRIDVAFLDLRMPTLDGFGLASNITAHFSAQNRAAVGPTLVACSADTSIGTVRRSKEAGIHLRLPKPFTGDALMRMLVKVAKQRNAASSVETQPGMNL